MWATNPENNNWIENPTEFIKPLNFDTQNGCCCSIVIIVTRHITGIELII